MPHLLQDLLILILPAYALLDNQGITILNYWPVTVGLVAGLIMGDMHTAMVIAGTFQLMSLGVAGLGGASVPDYGLATIVGIYLAARTGAGIGTAVAVGLPVGLLAIQFDVVIKLANNFIAHKAQEYAHKKEFNKMRMINWLGPLFFTMKDFIPMVIIITVGPSAVSAVLNVIPKWVTNGLTIAGGMLPVVGIGMLMHYMPTKKYIWAILAGFVFAAYLKLPVFGVAILGLAAAIIIFQQGMAKANKKNAAVAEGVDDSEEGDDYDE
ncbi:PTS mannose/fructose/sorbose/N-acetylgalactosamine transporter subunit IIC [Pediococcus argentinicus]|uniref:Phosphotransferase system n=1 Tax=Pediococcus argentinicus TaxID=480391 RepID=A0A0R2NI44_9LACO|nr:PTS sugar transporter subunit IIC [Pediococcus argentinicus]KRO25448.1 phosphotransferase system [Pediococcus argentinicus]NKZ22220.1 PTS sugar transporter subunit IIC [Pediococcus argentinicus]GEP19311.1 PTS N-acetylgalactosamine transporter subunit IIA [Pediococcus argentinicus]